MFPHRLIPVIYGGGGGGGGTPLTQYSGLTIEEVNAKFSGWVDVLPPDDSDPDWDTVIETSVGSANATAQANPGRQIRLTSGGGPTSLIQFTNCTDVQILIPQNFRVHLIRFDGGNTRCRVVGEGDNSQVDAGRVGSGTDDHITFHSLLMRGSDYNGITCNAFGGSVAFISCVASSVGDAASYRVGEAQGTAGHPTSLLLANCNFGAEANGGSNDWCWRLSQYIKVVTVDCFMEARGLQPVFRRGGGGDVGDTGAFHVRSYTYNENDGEGFADNSGGPGGEGIAEDCHLEDCVSYVGGTTNRFGGYNSAADDYSRIWRVNNHTWYYVAGNVVSDATMAAAEGLERNPGDWEYRLGSPSYNLWDGVTHPGWPSRNGLLTGTPMGTLDPYLL